MNVQFKLTIELPKAVPDHLKTNTDRFGCITFGLPEDVVGVDSAQRYGLEWVRPEPGLMMLPPHTCYRTYALNQSQRRTCVAFDIWSA
jgi:hypothetical protein